MHYIIVIAYYYSKYHRLNPLQYAVLLAHIAMVLCCVVLCAFLQVFTMGIYKSPSRSENSVMPFVCTCPAPKAILNRLDKLFVYGNYDKIKLAEAQLNLPFIVENRLQRLGKCGAVCF